MPSRKESQPWLGNVVNPMSHHPRGLLGPGNGMMFFMTPSHGSWWTWNGVFFGLSQFLDQGKVLSLPG